MLNKALDQRAVHLFDQIRRQMLLFRPLTTYGQHGINTLFGPHRSSAGLECGGGLHITNALTQQRNDLTVDGVNLGADILHIATLVGGTVSHEHGVLLFMKPIYV
ncbi:ADP-ribosylglycohydrolase [Zymobacter palmae]|uniref:ADP-ribosylglycohydrolase n=1 Tax=Zymobacter palmae TaxID=33074 RepID=A0A348HHB5_9GAMM|nr:ADP-ribosylglycohydrolase [Zymobacter palmae]